MGSPLGWITFDLSDLEKVNIKALYLLKQLS